MNKTKALSLQDLSTAQVAQLDPAEWLVVWPIGSLEQHGPHLPLGTDTFVLDGIVQQARLELGREFRGLFIPTMTIGKSPEHLDFVGTLSFKQETLLGMTTDIVHSLAQHKFSRFVFVNGHGGNTYLLADLAYELRQRYRVKAYTLEVWSPAFFDQVINKVFPTLEEQDGHAGAVETSLMLHLRPELVGPIPKGHFPPEFNTPVPYGWLSSDYNTQGAFGDPSQASAESGRKIFEMATAETCRLLRAVYDASG
ncbi:MAG: creatininase family protein [Anaerolineaceae bacterium]|nr:creatininase family protein [Anaerolineaceae bacterium]